MLTISISDSLKAVFPRPCLYLYRALRDREDAARIVQFIARRSPHTTVRGRARLSYDLYRISDSIPSPHAQAEVLSFIEEILNLPPDVPGVIVEAGCFKGSSTAKFSIAAERAQRRVVVFDSFRGIPPNTEDHGTNIFGEGAGFREGEYAGSLEEVRENVRRFGCADICEFKRGWFDDTMPGFAEPVAAAYLDVDLASSTYTCLRYLYPLLVPGGAIYSQDGHLPLVIEVFRDRHFWEHELRCAMPTFEGLGERKLVKLTKPADGGLMRKRDDGAALSRSPCTRSDSAA